MKKLLILIACLLALAGCGNTKDNPDTGSESKRFEVTLHDYGGFGRIRIITDTETGKQYLYYGIGNQGGLTLLEEVGD